MENSAKRPRQTAPTCGICRKPGHNRSNCPNATSCVVCFDKKHSDDFQPLTGNCHNGCKVCSNCVKNHIESEVNSKGDLKIRCPTCRTELDATAVNKFARRKDFDRFDKLTLNKTLAEFPEFRWCKKADCGSGQLHDGGDEYNVSMRLDLNVRICWKC